MAFVAGKRLLIGTKYREVGEPVPEAADWGPGTLRASLGVGEIIEVFGDVVQRNGRKDRVKIEAPPANVQVFEAQKPKMDRTESLAKARAAAAAKRAQARAEASKVETPTEPVLA